MTVGRSVLTEYKWAQLKPNSFFSSTAAGSYATQVQEPTMSAEGYAATQDEADLGDSLVEASRLQSSQASQASPEQEQEQASAEQEQESGQASQDQEGSDGGEEIEEQRVILAAVAKPKGKKKGKRAADASGEQEKLRKFGTVFPGEADRLAFIEAIRSREIIFDKTKRQYMDVAMRMAALAEVGVMFGISLEQTRKCWEHCRNMYGHCKQRIAAAEKSGAGADADPFIGSPGMKWWWEHMEWLAPHHGRLVTGLSTGRITGPIKRAASSLAPSEPREQCVFAEPQVFAMPSTSTTLPTADAHPSACQAPGKSSADAPTKAAVCTCPTGCCTDFRRSLFDLHVDLQNSQSNFFRWMSTYTAEFLKRPEDISRFQEECAALAFKFKAEIQQRESAQASGIASLFRTPPGRMESQVSEPAVPPSKLPSSSSTSDRSPRKQPHPYHYIDPGCSSAKRPRQPCPATITSGELVTVDMSDLLGGFS